MRPPTSDMCAGHGPQLGWLMALVAAFVLCLPAVAAAQDKPKGETTKPAKKGKKGKKSKPKGEDKFDFTGLNLEGRLRTPQLLYFLDRAAEELERASLEKRSFIPEMVKSIEEENL